MNKIIIANWKNNPETLEQARGLLEFSANEAAKYPDVKIVICPPEKFLLPITNYQLPITNFLGAQDVFWLKPEEMPQEIKYVLVGHSDRRYPPAGGGDTDEIINQKLKIALAAGAMPILLVGEKERSEDRQKILETQLSTALTNLTTSDVVQVVIAYEPVWAISRPDAEIDRPASEVVPVFDSKSLKAFGTSSQQTSQNRHGDAEPEIASGPTATILNPDTPGDILEVREIIKNFLSSKFQVPSSKFLYGGSVTKKNVADFLKHPEIGGAVIGGASLRKEEFANILKIVSRL